MRTLLIRLTNYKGLRNFEIKPGQITALVGGNGKGKTTVIDAVRSLARGGSEPDAVMVGEEEATIKWVLELQEGDCGGKYAPGRYEVERTISALGKFALNVKPPKGTKLTKFKEFVEDCLPKLAFDPISFDKLTDEQRAEKLNEVLKIPVTAKEIRAHASLVDLGVIEAEVFEDGIEAIDEFIEGLKKDASYCRSVIKDREGSINTMRELVDGQTAEDVAAALIAEKLTVKKETDALNDAHTTLRETLSTAIAEATRVAAVGHGATNQWHMLELEKLNKAVAERRKSTEDALGIAKDLANKTYTDALEPELEPIRARIAGAMARVGALEEKSKKAEQLAGAKQQLEAWEAETQERRDKLESIGVAVEQLGRLRVKKLALMKLDGMQIKKGRLFIGEVLSSLVNTAARIMKWVEIATTYANDGQLILVDDMEHLTDENRKIFEECIRQTNLQLLVTLVDPAGGPLRVEDKLSLA